ncbi:hypothetical protein [Methanococcus vannielii]|nr:hypothetical protein [Methanococcus vannielii]
MILSDIDLETFEITSETLSISPTAQFCSSVETSNFSAADASFSEIRAIS